MDAAGLVLLAHVHAADLHDRLGAQLLVGRAGSGELPRLQLVWADGAYAGTFARWLEAERGWRVEVPKHRDRHLWRYGLEEKPRGFQVIPRRWVVELFNDNDRDWQRQASWPEPGATGAIVSLGDDGVGCWPLRAGPRDLCFHTETATCRECREVRVRPVG